MSELLVVRLNAIRLSHPCPTLPAHLFTRKLFHPCCGSVKLEFSSGALIFSVKGAVKIEIGETGSEALSSLSAQTRPSLSANIVIQYVNLTILAAQ